MSRLPWRAASSDAEPELRAVLQHARAQGPSEAQLAALSERVRARLEQEHAPILAPRPAVRRARAGGVVGLVLVAGLLALGAIAWRRAQPVPAARRHPLGANGAAPSALHPSAQAGWATPSPSAAALRAPPAASEETAASVPAQITRSAGAESTPTRRRALREPRRARIPALLADAGATADEASEDELALLFRARRILVADPARALALAAAHDARFRQSSFAEEREALAIEALARVGKLDEASTRSASFALRYPRSVYRERLRVLLAPRPYAGELAH